MENELKLKDGAWIYCKSSGDPDLRMGLSVGKLYQVKYDGVFYVQKAGNSYYYFNNLINGSCYFRNATESEIAEVEKPTTWIPKTHEKVLAKIHKLNEFKEFEYAVCINNEHYVFDSIFNEKVLSKAVEIKKITPIPYLSEIEALIQKSNKESDFSVITYNVEKK